MPDDDQREHNRAEMERLRVATPDDIHAFGELVTPKPPPDRTRLGVPLAEAVWRFARDLAIGRRFLDLAWRTRIKSDSPDLLTFEERQEYHDLRNGLEAELVERLAAGEVEAIRLLDGGTREVVTLVTWWFGARLDSEQDEATSHGEPVRGLLFRLPTEAADAPAAQTSTIPTGPKRVFSEQALRAWFLIRISTYPKAWALPREDDCKAMVPAGWKKRGPRGPRISPSAKLPRK